MAPRLGLGGGVSADPASGLFAGGIPDATNDWNFALNQRSDSALNSVDDITFSRGSVGWVMNDAGNLVEVASGEPRYGYDTSDNSLGLLMERASTNLMWYSDLSSNMIAFESNGIDRSSNTTTGPDGVSGSGYSINTVAGTKYHITYVSTELTTADLDDADERCYSIYAKAGNADYLRMGFTLNFVGATTQVGASFDLTSGSVDKQERCTAYTENVGNGWYRCVVHSTNMPATDGNHYRGPFFSPSNTALAYESPDNVIVESRDEGGANEHVFLWGMNIEGRVGLVDRTFPTSFIETGGGTATRVIDQATASTSDWGWSATEGSMLIELERTNTADASGDMGIFSIAGGSGNHLTFDTSTTEENFQIVSGAGAGGTAVMDAGDDVAPNTPYKIAAGWKANDVAVTLNGATSVTDTSFTLADVFSGDPITLGGSLFSGFIKRVRYWNTKLTNEQLEELST
tara:strand:- start:343 stop:1719 length:1377 start_codon:yes stop_codon:yes gene_type:complete